MAATTDPLRQLAALAIEAAIVAPRKQGRFTRKAGVPWTLVHRIRKACEDAGIDWRSFANGKGGLAS